MGYADRTTGTTSALGVRVTLEDEDDRPPTDDEVRDAILADLRADLIEQAAKRFRAWPREVGYALIAAVAGDSMLGPRLAKMFRLASVHAKAAEVYENLGDWVRAARCHEKARRWDLAAECFLRADAPLDAARMFEAAEGWSDAARAWLQAREPVRAARALLRAGEAVRAVELFIEARHAEEAARTMLELPRDTRGYWEALLLVLRALDAARRPDIAIRLGVECLRGATLDGAIQPVFYQLARLLERTGNVRQAHRQYAKLAAFDPGYRDVGLRAATTSDWGNAVRPARPSPSRSS